MDAEGDAINPPRRGRSTGLGAGSAGVNGTFARHVVLREATRLGVSREDRSRLEALARFAMTNPGFRAVTPVSLGGERRDSIVFEVTYTPDGPIVHRIDSELDLLTTLAELDPASFEAEPEEPAVPAAEATAPDPLDLSLMLTEAAASSPDLMATFGRSGRRLLWANDSLRARLQVPAWAAPPLIELLDDPSQGTFVVKVLPALLSEGTWQGRLVLVGPDVAPVPVNATLMMQHRPNGGGHGLVINARATTDPAPARRLRGADDHFGALVEHVSDLIAVIEPGGVIRYTSPAASTMLGREPGELVGTRLADLLHPDDVMTDVSGLVHLDPVTGDGVPTSLRLRSSDGTWRSIEAVVTDLTANPAIKGFVLNARDTTERVRAYEMLSQLAYTDPDTGLPNRLRLIDRITTLLETPDRSVTVMVIDLDDFRSVNETHGPRVGDALLGEIARRLVDGAGGDALVARLRSVEFAVVLPDVDEISVAERAADALRVIVARPFIFEGHSARVSASIGMAVGASGEQADDLLRRASQATGEAKRNGGNNIAMWGEETARRENRRRVVEQRLQRVLSEGGVRVDYQPIVSVGGGALVGAEALLRIRDREDDLLNPAEFIEAAESSGLLLRLGTQMLEATCEQISKWDAQLRNRAPDHVCVNVSPRQLVDPGLATQVVAALEVSAIDAGRLWLEVTESTLVAHNKVLGERIGFLRDLGVRIGLDEFGAGYSTLDYLKRFPLDFVKIDRSLVSGLGADQRDSAIVRATVQLAHSLGLTVVAVGVETAEQLEILADLGCDHAQGYLFSAPVAPESLLVKLDRDAALAPSAAR